MEEQELIRLLQQRDPRGAEVLLQQYSPLLRYLIAPILADERDREDCLSEVAMKVWEKIGQYDGQRGSWTSWLTAVTRNTALNKLRQLGKREEDPPEESLPSPAPGPEEALLQAERQQALETALAALSQKDRRLFYRKYYYLQSTAQIAAELGLSTRAVEGRLYRIKKRLRELLGGGAHE